MTAGVLNPPAPVAGQDGDGAGGEPGRGQVDVAVQVEVRRGQTPAVRDGDERGGPERPGPGAQEDPQPRLAVVGDREVGQAVVVEVGGRDVAALPAARGVEDVGGEPAGPVVQEHVDGVRPPAGHGDVGLAVPVEVPGRGSQPVESVRLGVRRQRPVDDARRPVIGDREHPGNGDADHVRLAVPGNVGCRKGLYPLPDVPGDHGLEGAVPVPAGEVEAVPEQRGAEQVELPVPVQVHRLDGEGAGGDDDPALGELPGAVVDQEVHPDREDAGRDVGLAVAREVADPDRLSVAPRYEAAVRLPERDRRGDAVFEADELQRGPRGGRAGTRATPGASG